jgi:transposase
MKDRLSTREAAEKLGVTLVTLQRYVAAKTGAGEGQAGEKA